MLEKKEYSSLHCIDGDTDACEDLLNYSGGTYICDAITETADSNVHIYNNDLWETAPSISDYIEEAIEEGLVDTSKVDLMKIFMAGEYQYYTQLLYDNLETIVYNYAVDCLNKKYPDIEIDEDELKAKLEGIDNNDTFDKIEEAVEELIEEMKEATEEEEEDNNNE